MRAVPQGFGSGHKFERKGSEDHRNHLKTMEKHIKLHNQDWRNVVVYNMHPFPIQQHFGDAGLVTVAKCEEGKPYNAHLIDMYRLSKEDKGNGEWEPVEILPVELAQELVRKYTTQGGVFWHYADEAVPVEKLKAAGARQLNYYRALVRMARDEWARHKSMARVSDAQRQAARYMARLGEVNLNEFEWVEKLKLPICAQCGEDHKPEARVCKHCEYPLDFAWVRQFRKDLVAKYGIGDGPVGGEVPVAAATVKQTAEQFLDETFSADDAKLMGGN